MKRLATLLSLAALAGCSLEPHYLRPTPAVPPTFPVGGAYPETQAPLPAAVDRRAVFLDPKLLAIIDRALANSQDLRAALANVAAARALYRVQRSDQFPQIGLTGRVSTGDRGGSGTTTTTGTGTGTIGGTGTGGGTIGGTTGTGTTGGGTTGTGTTGGGTTGTTTGGTTGSTIVTSGGRTTSYELEAGVTAFELDLFGRLRSLSRAAFQEYLATDATARAARLTLVAEVATAYLTLATDRSLLAVAVDTEASAARSVALTDARLKGGIAPRSDLAQAQTVLDQARIDHADLDTAVAQDRNALELLVGAPVPDADLPASIEAVDGLLAALPAGLDSRVLLRRPDVVAAEHRLRAANARIGAARAAFFPTISLTAVAGFASTALSSLFTGGGFTWSAGPSVSLPIFDGGANRGNLAYAEAERELAVAQYRQAIQSAFRDVADALARRGTIDRQFAAQSDFARAAETSYRLADARYREGIDTFLASLDAQRTLYAARRSLAAARLLRADNLVALFQTLGGDETLDTAEGAPPLVAGERTGR